MEARGAPEKGDKNPEVVAGPQSQGLRESPSQEGGHKIVKPPEPQPGAFFLPKSLEAR